jgi:hypothetical protein
MLLPAADRKFLRNLYSSVTNFEPGDNIFFSGSGGQMRDEDRTEADDLDECFVCLQKATEFITNCRDFKASYRKGAASL